MQPGADHHTQCHAAACCDCGFCINRMKTLCLLASCWEPLDPEAANSCCLRIAASRSYLIRVSRPACVSTLISRHCCWALPEMGQSGRLQVLHLSVLAAAYALVTDWLLLACNQDNRASPLAAAEVKPFSFFNRSLYYLNTFKGPPWTRMCQLCRQGVKHT